MVCQFSNKRCNEQKFISVNRITKFLVDRKFLRLLPVKWFHLWFCLINNRLSHHKFLFRTKMSHSLYSNKFKIFQLSEFCALLQCCNSLGKKSTTAVVIEISWLIEFPPTVTPQGVPQNKAWLSPAQHISILIVVGRVKGGPFAISPLSNVLKNAQLGLIDRVWIPFGWFCCQTIPNIVFGRRNSWMRVSSGLGLGNYF